MAMVTHVQAAGNSSSIRQRRASKAIELSELGQVRLKYIEEVAGQLGGSKFRFVVDDTKSPEDFRVMTSRTVAVSRKLLEATDSSQLRCDRQLFELVPEFTRREDAATSAICAAMLVSFVRSGECPPWNL